MAIQYIAIPTSTLVVLLIILSHLLPQITGIQASIQRLHHQAPAYEDLLAFQVSADANHEFEADPCRALPTANSSITLQDLGYTYEGTTRPIFTGLNASLPVNSTIAITGCSGIGKSTLADILGGLLWPQTGLIVLDGNPLQAEDVLGWRKQWPM